MSYNGLLSRPDPDTPFASDTTIGEYTLRNTTVRRMKETNARVNVYDVLNRDGARVGLAHLTADNSAAAHQHGHVCVNLAENTSTPEKLAGIARGMIQIAHEAGVQDVRIVVPADHRPSVGACELAGPVGAPEPVTVQTRSHLVYTYRRN